MKIDVSLVDWAAEQATAMLAPLGERWLHVQGVVERAQCVGEVLDEEDRSYLIVAVYLSLLLIFSYVTKHNRKSNAQGYFYSASTLRKVFLRFLVSIGLPHMRFHDLRHSAATILLAMKVHPKVV